MALVPNCIIAFASEFPHCKNYHTLCGSVSPGSFCIPRSFADLEQCFGYHKPHFGFYPNSSALAHLQSGNK